MQLRIVLLHCHHGSGINGLKNEYTFSISTQLKAFPHSLNTRASNFRRIFRIEIAIASKIKETEARAEEVEREHTEWNKKKEFPLEKLLLLQEMQCINELLNKYVSHT